MNDSKAIKFSQLMQNFHHLLQISYLLSFIGDYSTEKQGERLEKHTHKQTLTIRSIYLLDRTKSR